MNFANILTRLNIPAFALIAIGLATFKLACICQAQDIRSAVLAAATGLISAGLMSFQHKQETQDPLPQVDAPKKA